MNLATQPINYLGSNQQPDIASELMQGLQIGMTLRKMREERQQAELTQQRQEQFRNDFSMAWDSKDPNSFISLMGKHPEFGKQFKEGYDILNEQQKKNEFSTGLQIYSALQSTNPQIAKDLVTNLKTAAENSGQPADEYDFLLDTINKDPEMAKNYMKMALSAAAPDKWAESMGKVGQEQRAAEMQPLEMRKKKAETSSAETTAKYADSTAMMELDKKGWDIKKLQSDIEANKANTRIAAMNAQLNKEGNSLKRQELQIKIEDAKRERDEKVQSKAADITAARDSMDNFLNTAERLLSNPDLNDAIGAIEGRLPAMSDKTADIVSLIDTLKAQSFMAAVPNMKGMGQLSDKEGARLEASIQNLGRVQSETQFLANLKEAQRLIKKARTNLATRYGVPDTEPDIPDQSKPSNTATVDIRRTNSGATVSNW